jgi:hypothetical protein
MKECEPLRACEVRFLPVISAYARTLGIVEEIDRLCGSKHGVSNGHIVLALVLDALSGRSPLFRLPQNENQGAAAKPNTLMSQIFPGGDEGI